MTSTVFADIHHPHLRKVLSNASFTSLTYKGRAKNKPLTRFGAFGKKGKMIKRSA